MTSRRAYRGHRQLSVGWLQIRFLAPNRYQLLSIHRMKFKFPGTEEGPSSSSHFSLTPGAPAVLKCPGPGDPLMSRPLQLSGLHWRPPLPRATITGPRQHTQHTHSYTRTHGLASGYPGLTPPRPRASLLQAEVGISVAEELALAKCGIKHGSHWAAIRSCTGKFVRGAEGLCISVPRTPGHTVPGP